MSKYVTAVLIVLMSLPTNWSLTAIAAAEQRDSRVTLSDGRGGELRLSAPAERVISLAPHITEVVYAAGAGDKLVGAVSYSDYPEAAKQLPRVGSYDSVNVESLINLKPDLVLAWRSGNGEDVIQRLRSLGLPVYASEPRTLDDVADLIDAIGILTGEEHTAAVTAQRYRKRLAKLRETYSQLPPVSVYYQIWNEPLLTLNGEHLISDVVRLCSGRNVFADATPMVLRISVESVLQANPDVIVASGMDEARPEWLNDWRRWKSIRAVANDQLYFVPPDILQRHTPRIVEGAALLCKQLSRARKHYGLVATKGAAGQLSGNKAAPLPTRGNENKQGRN